MADNPKLKVVRALRTGSYDGHRRRAGVEFVVAADCNETWFEEVREAPADAELPTQLSTAQAPRGKSFVEVMEQLKAPKSAPVGPEEQTLAEAARELPVITPTDPDADLS